MTPEELDEARAKEAEERWRDMHPNDRKHTLVGTIAARLAREGWTPPEPEPVDPDILAWRELAMTSEADDSMLAKSFVYGARMAREQERERAKPLAQYLQDLADRDDAEADHILAKYRGEA